MGKRENAAERRQRREKRAATRKAREQKEKTKEQAAAAREVEEDIDAILKELEVGAQKRQPKVESAQPSPRSAASLLPHPSGEELMLFGGEHYNGKRTFVYDDLYFYNIRKKEWRVVVLEKSPPARCAHQACIVPRNGGEMWVFGGEFSSPSGNQFHHYNDLWVLRLAEMKWEKIEAKGGPSARSGHRMCLYKRLLVVFGGFHDNGKKAARYFNDLHVFDLDAYTWTRVDFPAIFITPETRSAAQFLSVGETLLLIGGYTKVNVKGELYTGKVHEDMWQLSTAPEGPPDKHGKRPPCCGAGLQWTWSRQKPSGAVPSARSGCAAVVRHAASVFVFGGVTDEETEDSLQGHFFNDAYTLVVDSLKYFPLELKGGKEKEAEPAAKRESHRRRHQTLPGDLEEASGSEESEGDAPAPSAITTTAAGTTTSSSTLSAAGGGAPAAAAGSSRSEASAASSAATAAATAAATTSTGGAAGRGASMVWPSPRMNAMLAVVGSTLFLLGGTLETEDRCLTLSDMYSLDLAKNDRWVQLQDNDPQTQQWLGEESSSSDDSDDSSGSEQDESEEDEEAGKKGKAAGKGAGGKGGKAKASA